MTSRTAAVVLAASLLSPLGARQPPAGRDPQPAAGREVVFTASPVNVAESRGPVSIHILRWSTDEERTALTRALSAPASTTAGADTGAARGGRAAAAGRGGRGGPGRGARGAAAEAPPNPIAALTAAIARAPTIGYIWTTDVTGYSIKYAYRAPSASGERIVLATDRRFGENSAAWALATATSPTDYGFTVFEFHLDAAGSGEGKSSLTASVIVDDEAKTVALRDYAAATPILALRGGAVR